MSYQYVQSGGAQYSPAPQQMMVTTSAAPAPSGGLPPGIPAGASYQGSIQKADGSVIDRYAVPQRASIPVRQVVPEVQQYHVYGQTSVPETRQIQVPVQRMIQVQETIMVPQTIMVPKVQTKMIPKQEMVTQNITVQKPVQTVQTMQRTISKVVEGQKILQSSQVIEYERPKMIPGRLLGAQQTPAQEVGLQWNRQYFTQSGTADKAVSPIQISAAMAQQQQYTTTSPVQVVTNSTPPGYYGQSNNAVMSIPQPAGYYTQSNNTYASQQYFNAAMPQYATQPGFMAQQQQEQPFAGYDDKEGAF